MQKNLKKKFTCLGENTENYITFTVAIEKEVTRTDKNGEEFSKIYPTDYNLLMSLSNLVNKLSERNQKTKCNYGNNDKNCGACAIKYRDCNFLKS